MIAIGSDHAGYELKEKIKRHLEDAQIPYRDYGTLSAESCDYPDYGAAVARAVSEQQAERGIVICSTGIGISIAANKINGIRAALCHNVYSAKLCRQHNDANVLAIGANVIGPGLSIEIVDAFLNTGFDGGRHAKRVGKITELEM